MKYRLIYTQRAIRDIKSLDPKIKERIGSTLLRYKKEPLDYAEKLTDSNHRVVFDIEGSDIIVLRVGHRREIYKRR